MSEIAVLIPCLNEELTIGKVIEDFRKELPGASIYVFNNRSTDQTKKVALSHGVTVYDVEKRGKGNVVRDMFERVVADIYILVDGDDTYLAKDVHKLIQPIQSQKADMTVGNRRSNAIYDKQNTRPFHSFGNSLVCFLISKIFDSKIKDAMTGYRAFSRFCIQSLAIVSDGFTVETEITIQSLHKRLRIKEIPIDYKERPEGSTSKLNTFRDGFRVIKTIFNLFRCYNPITFFSYLALVILMISLGFGIPVVADYMETGLVDRFPTAFMAMGLSIISMISFITGLILDTIVRQKIESDLLRSNELRWKNKPDRKEQSSLTIKKSESLHYE